MSILQVRKAVLRPLLGATMGGCLDAVLSAKCTFVRMGIGAVEDSFLALLQPAVLEETYRALVQQEKNGVALKRHLNFMEKCVSMTPEVLMREMEEGWTKRPKSISEEVCTELWRAHMRPAFEYVVRRRAEASLGDQQAPAAI